YRVSSGDLTSKFPITRIEIRIGIRLRIQYRLNLPSRVESSSPRVLLSSSKFQPKNQSDPGL
ncbi:hypothetical protein AVEN_30832-1, partial [Araneus ventricosus]